jgi:hypothetical protein
MAEEDFGDEEGGVVKAGAGEAFGGGEEEGCEGRGGPGVGLEVGLGCHFGGLGGYVGGLEGRNESW